ncbi:hypothetical protein [Tenacibaculum agarivorans]|uniref:hypothetical protein n=1 Tax=Tenacibaculum agarivorans TaxID=1908389 RepID=UPI00094B944B|nr:hypothetical protein [Tenacibaculum agarivorans]
MKISIKLNLLLFTLIILSSCSNSKDDSPIFFEDVNLKEARLTNFLLTETNYLNIEIEQPIIENNEEIKEGKIIITLPHTTTSLNLSLKSVNINGSDFNISPSVGAQVLFSQTEFVKYTITSIANSKKSIHYNVKVIISSTPQEQKLSITDFELLANDNSAFTNIDFIKESISLQSVDSLLFCLFPKTIDFSDLTPAIKYHGSKIEYRVNNDDFEEYPVETGKSINFKYPNTVDFKVSNSTTSITYRIIVDTQHPVIFTEDIVIPDLKMGDTYNGIGVTSWTNNGNYPISTMSPNEYSDVISPATGLNNIFTATLTKNSGGNINPDENGLVNIIVNNTPLIGQYEAVARFNLNFNENSWKIVNFPTDKFINDVGYKTVDMKIKGTIIN